MWLNIMGLKEWTHGTRSAGVKKYLRTRSLVVHIFIFPFVLFRDLFTRISEFAIAHQAVRLNLLEH